MNFEKVSLEQFTKDCKKLGYETNNIKEIYNSINIPSRATINSAGYDFYSPFDIILNNKESLVIPTGIRCKMPEDIFLSIFPRSSLGFKYMLQLKNTVGVIDSDYYYSDNEGHIMISVVNNNNDNANMIIAQNERFCQGIFMKYFVTDNDNCTNIRNGGIGSTNKE